MADWIHRASGIPAGRGREKNEAGLDRSDGTTSLILNTQERTLRFSCRPRRIPERQMRARRG